MFYRHLKVSVARSSVGSLRPDASPSRAWRAATRVDTLWLLTERNTTQQGRCTAWANLAQTMRRQRRQARREPRCVVSLAHVPERESLIRSVRAKTLVSPGRGGAGIPWCCSSSALDPRGGRADTLALWRCPRLSTLTLGADTSARIHIAPRL